MIIPNIWENTKCSKPPTRYVHLCTSMEESTKGLWKQHWSHGIMIDHMDEKNQRWFALVYRIAAYLACPCPFRGIFGSLVTGQSFLVGSVDRWQPQRLAQRPLRGDTRWCPATVLMPRLVAGLGIDVPFLDSCFHHRNEYLLDTFGYEISPRVGWCETLGHLSQPLQPLPGRHFGSDETIADLLGYYMGYATNNIHMWVSMAMVVPQNGWFSGTSCEKVDDLRIPPMELEPPISIIFSMANMSGENVASSKTQLLVDDWKGLYHPKRCGNGMTLHTYTKLEVS